jgi:hypothetical protein
MPAELPADGASSRDSAAGTLPDGLALAGIIGLPGKGELIPVLI